MSKVFKRKVKIYNQGPVDLKKILLLEEENKKLHELNDELVLALRQDDTDLKEYRAIIKEQTNTIQTLTTASSVVYINGQKFTAPSCTTSCFNINDEKNIFLCHAVFAGLCDPKTVEYDALYVDTYKYNPKDGSYTLAYHTDGNDINNEE